MKKKTVNKSNLEALRLVSHGVKGMITVSAMEEERYCPTIFTSYNRAVGIGGQPLRRMIAVHGKNQTGKSVFAAGIAESMRRFNHIPVIFEAEWSAEKRWLNRLVMGEGTLFDMPADLDELFSKIQKNLDNLRNAKEKGLIPDEIGCCFVVDTLTKLIPKEQFDSMIKDGIEKSYSMQSMWISLWSKIIVPQIYRSNSSLILVLQERQNIGAGKFAKKRKVTLGEALLYDISLRIECTHSTPVMDGDKMLASQFHYNVEKNKSDGFTDQSGSFFTSTGEGDTAPGFDYCREAIEEANVRGLIKKFKEKKIDQISIQNKDDKPIITVPGGIEDLRWHLKNNESDMQNVVEFLNSQARRIKNINVGNTEKKEPEAVEEKSKEKIEDDSVI